MGRRAAWSSVWITGASSGIGRALARLLDGETNVALSARSADTLGHLAQHSKTLSAFPLDVTDVEATRRTIDAIEDLSGPIDLAVLNAGAWQLMDADALDLDAVRRGVDVNIMGVMAALDVLIPRMIERGSGHIAIVASIAGYSGLPRSIAYGPTKAALINLAETLRLELAPRGITVSLVNPGFVDTPMTQTNPFPMPALMTPEAAAARMLAGLRAGRFEIVFPRRFVYVLKMLRILPYWLYFWLVGFTVERPAEADDLSSPS